jgi:nucleotide-binding universal stress UspA family protein
MAVIKTILVPTDFAPASDRALAYARQLADAVNASLHILHVVDDPFAAGAYMEMHSFTPTDYLRQMEEAARTRLDSLLSDDQKSRYAAVLATRIGAPAHQILDYLRDVPAIDLVVMATAGRGGVARFMMGSVADKVIRHARCPVLTLDPYAGPHAEAGHAA